MLYIYMQKIYSENFRATATIVKGFPKVNRACAGGGRFLATPVNYRRLQGFFMMFFPGLWCYSINLNFYL
jgi:hypothetical protein